MTDKLNYSYVVLRYVHDVITGEFVNVGVVLFVPRTNTLLVRTQKRVGRLKGAFPDVRRDIFVATMGAVERAARQLARTLSADGLISRADSAGSIVKLVLPSDDSSLQWSPVGAGQTEDVKGTFERVYMRFVTSHDPHMEHGLTDNDVWRPVKDRLLERNIPLDLQEKVVVGTTDKIEFKRAWKNGVWHAFEPLSFDLKDSDGIRDKARRWRGHLEAVSEGVDEKIRIHFILGSPRRTGLSRAFRTAKEILSRSPFNPDLFEETEVDELVSQIEDEVRAYRRSEEA